MTAAMDSCKPFTLLRPTALSRARSRGQPSGIGYSTEHRFNLAKTLHPILYAASTQVK